MAGAFSVHGSDEQILAQINKSCTRGGATKKRKPSMNKEGWSVWPTVHFAPLQKE